ncbi:MAG: protein kinase [Myxococcales bacterium]|nr:protein kinase [Myxococcales bacterium]
MTEIAEGTEVTPSIRLKRRLSAGGMGSVWIADHSTLKTEVVVKFLHDRLAEDPTSQARFAREASAASQVKSPHVVQMFDHGVMEGGHPFIVMELLEGRDLAQEIRRGVLAPALVAHILEHISLALGRAHSRNIVHRDIKPNNIFLCDVGGSQPFVKLLDFGIAREGDHNLTTTGHLVGTPAFMSPEQLSGRPVDAQSDLWSLAMVALKALTGKNPYERPTIPETLGAVVHGDVPVPSAFAPDLPAGVDAWFARACARDPSQRFGSAAELSEAFWLAIGMPKLPISSPTASSGPISAGLPTVSITPAEPITEGTLRSTVDGRSHVGSLAPPAPGPRRRALSAIAAVAVLVVVGGVSFRFGAASPPAPARLQVALGTFAETARGSRALATPRAVESSAPTASGAPTPSSAPAARVPALRPPHKTVAPRPKPKDDDDVGF